MPAAKKTTKKLKSNNVNGRKKILLISVLALVVIGAAAVIRSFAATTVRVATYNIASNNLYGSRQAPGGTWATVTDTEKGTASALQLNGPAFAQTRGGYTLLDSNKTYRTCALIKKVSGDPYIILYGPGAATTGTNPNRYRVTSTSYTEFCNASGKPGSGQIPSVLNNPAVGSSSIINISAIYFDDVSATVTPVVNPTPPK